jgi:hypothetical protein
MLPSARTVLLKCGKQIKLAVGHDVKRERLFLASTCQYATDKSKPTKTADISKEAYTGGKSILEEVLIKEEAKPKTTAQKGKVFSTATCTYTLVFSEERSREYVLLCVTSHICCCACWDILPAV